MQNYRCNPKCGCARCRLAGMVGPAVLVTLGVLFLLDNVGWRGFHDTWPLLLIVIGIVKVLQYTASTDGHRDPLTGLMYDASGAVITPPAPAGELPTGPTENHQQEGGHV